MVISDVVTASIATAIFTLLFIPAVMRFHSQEKVVFHLGLYMAMGMFLSLSMLLDSLQITYFGVNFYDFVIGFTLLGVVLGFGGLTLNFTKKSQSALKKYWGTVLLILLFWTVLVYNFGSWPENRNQFLVNTGFGDSLIEQIPLALSMLAWLISLITALIALVLEFRKTQHAHYRNKLRYWMVITLMMVGSGIILFLIPSLFKVIGLLLITISGLLIGYTVLSYHTTDLKLLISRAVRYLLVTALLSVIYFLGLGMTILITRSNHLPYPTVPLLWAVMLAILLSIFIPPLWRMARNILTRFVFDHNARPNKKQIIQQYRQSISSALDMQRLGDILIKLMIETFGLEHGLVLVNERSVTGDINLRPLSFTGSLKPDIGQFPTDSPFIDHFRKGNKILNHYDVDVLPEFKLLTQEERDWLTNLNMEFYVPIILQRELIGLLGFGLQPQGTSYYEEDFDLMITLADQAALAMDSARLFEQLATINQEVGQLTNALAGVDQDKADFLSIASHELRTPLTHIHGYSRMLLDLTEDELQNPAYVKSLIQGVAKGSERMKSILDLMFDVTEAHVGEMNLFLGPVTLEEVIDQATRPLLPALDERRIAFAKQGFQADAVTIEADGTRLVQAFENLISNAIKYTPDGGMVTVENRSVVLDDIGSAVEIIVSDTGIGIDEKHHERIFEKFFRVDDTSHHSTGKTKFKGAGPGLGLTLVKGIAEAHGGKIWVESPGHDEEKFPGSKFYFVIPLHPIQPDDEEEGKKVKQSQIETRHWRRSEMKKAETSK